MFTKRIGDNAEMMLFEPRHADHYYALIDANRERLRKWFTWVDGTRSRDDTLAFIVAARRRYAERGDITAGIWYDGQVAGSVGLEDIDQESGTAEIGYWLGEAYEGKGLVTNACRTLLDYAFRDLGLSRVQLRVQPTNERSKAVARRLDFQYEGTLRRAAKQYGRPIDLEVYSMLSDEWKG
jgi:ribosomal-protein-serine acetyltransferase